MSEEINRLEETCLAGGITANDSCAPFVKLQLRLLDATEIYDVDRTQHTKLKVSLASRRTSRSELQAHSAGNCYLRP